MHFDQRTCLGRWLYRNQWVLPRNWFKARRARAAVLEATYVYLNDMLSFWEGEPCPGELRAKDLLCATLALQWGDYSGALGLIESSTKRAQFIKGVRP
jgi:hypothetical protein